MRYQAPMNEAGVQKAFHRGGAGAQAGLNKPARVHSLRHSWATHLLESGVNLRVLQLWMGHTSPTTTAIYTHLTRNAEQLAPTRWSTDRRAAMSTLGEIFRQYG